MFHVNWRQTKLSKGGSAINCVRTDSGAINRFMGYNDKKHTSFNYVEINKDTFFFNQKRLISKQSIVI